MLEHTKVNGRNNPLMLMEITITQAHTQKKGGVKLFADL